MSTKQRSERLYVWLAVIMLMVSILVAGPSATAAPLQQEDPQPRSISDARAAVFLPLVSASGLSEGAEAETDLQSLSSEAVSQSSFVCNVIEKDIVPLYARIDFTTGRVSGLLYILTPRRGFRVYSEVIAYGTGKIYAYGYSAEKKSVKGWVQLIHLNCPMPPLNASTQP